MTRDLERIAGKSYADLSRDAFAGAPFCAYYLNESRTIVMLTDRVVRDNERYGREANRIAHHFLHEFLHDCGLTHDHDLDKTIRDLLLWLDVG